MVGAVANPVSLKPPIHNLTPVVGAGVLGSGLGLGVGVEFREHGEGAG